MCNKCDAQVGNQCRRVAFPVFICSNSHQMGHPSSTRCIQRCKFLMHSLLTSLKTVQNCSHEICKCGKFLTTQVDIAVFSLHTQSFLAVKPRDSVLLPLFKVSFSYHCQFLQDDTESVEAILLKYPDLKGLNIVRLIDVIGCQ